MPLRFRVFAFLLGGLAAAAAAASPTSESELSAARDAELSAIGGDRELAERVQALVAAAEEEFLEEAEATVKPAPAAPEATATNRSEVGRRENATAMRSVAAESGDAEARPSKEATLKETSAGLQASKAASVPCGERAPVVLDAMPGFMVWWGDRLMEFHSSMSGTMAMLTSAFERLGDTNSETRAAIAKLKTEHEALKKREAEAKLKETNLKAMNDAIKIQVEGIEKNNTAMEKANEGLEEETTAARERRDQLNEATLKVESDKNIFLERFEALLALLEEQTKFVEDTVNR